jgi:3-phenylpropionate/trans-cinnamate dioxygenase ferredoxin reductase component
MRVAAAVSNSGSLARVKVSQAEGNPMPAYRYLIAGGGLTADGACKGIRDVDQQGSIGVVGAEPHPPYLRPPLSKDLWKGDPEDKIWRGTADLGVELHLSRTVVELDLSEHEATDSEGETYTYERLLLATGGTPRRLPFGGDDVIYYRTLDDYRRLRRFADAHARAVVIGGGFIGSEVAAALAMNGCPVTMVFPDPGICSRIFPVELSAFVTDLYREKGVEVLADGEVTGIERDGDHLHVGTGDGQTLEADVVVSGIGIAPNTEIAEAAGLPVDDGVVVDAFGRVDGHEDVFAAGDVARFPEAGLDEPTRVEHEDHAKNHGRAVGKNMAGANTPYDRMPFFYSDLFDLGYEAVGDLDARRETVAEWKTPNHKGLIYYLDDERRPRGILLWNVWEHVDDARELIKAGERIDRRSLAHLL